ncbi:hypothetical protein LSAT2_029930 [Lamellibrachia satsuma]|nr:hypothetical protein LSAT2_029930 [Lamellibrachia satsuma]
MSLGSFRGHGDPPRWTSREATHLGAQAGRRPTSVDKPGATLATTPHLIRRADDVVLTMPVAVSLTCGLLLLLCEATAYPIAMSGLSLGESLQEEVDAAPWLSGPTRKRSRSISINQDLVSLANMVANTDHRRRVEEAKILLNKIGKRDVHGRDVTGTRDITSRRDATGRRDVIGQRDVSGRTLPVRSAGTTAGSEAAGSGSRHRRRRSRRCRPPGPASLTSRRGRDDI